MLGIPGTQKQRCLFVGSNWCPRRASWGDLSGAIGQYVSDGRTEPFTRNSGRAGLYPFRLVDSTRGHTRQVAPTRADVGHTELYSEVRTCQPGSGLAEASDQPTLGNTVRPDRLRVLNHSQMCTWTRFTHRLVVIH